MEISSLQELFLAACHQLSGDLSPLAGLKSLQKLSLIKVLFLGNDGVGKTQLCRRLRDLPFDAESEAGAGEIRLRTWGENAESLIDLVLDPLRQLPVGQAPQIEQTKRFPVRGFISSSGLVKTCSVVTLYCTASPTNPKLLV